MLTLQSDEKTVCPAARSQQMVSGKYKLRILWGLKEGWRRYGEIKSGLLTDSVAQGKSRRQYSYFQHN
jgi:DNA-binding HxlR family transcriptional regulator